MHHRDASGDAPDEPSYPLAPLPVHERTWRHPSEVGQATWESSEPPIVIGRGLLVATTAIGFVLGLAVLLLLVPAGDGRFVAVRSAENAVLPTAVVNTVLVHQQSAEQLPGTALGVAVAVAEHGLMITTANALSNSALDTAAGVSLLGDRLGADGTIVSVDDSLAFILPSSSVDVTVFDEVDTAMPGDVVTVLAEQPMDVTYGSQLDGAISSAGVREGTPVVDEHGALVALCTLVRRDGAVEVDLVPVPQGAPTGRTVPTGD